MRPDHLPLLRSPTSGRPLELLAPVMVQDKVREGWLSDGESRWPITNFIPRFVPESAYWDSFSFQWTRHPRLLSERYSGYSVYKDRFEQETRWPADLSGEVIIEAGCGSGGFTRLALATGATVLSFDASRSVDWSYRDNDAPNLLVVQASLYDMPFVLADRVFCFGVLQHTPDPATTVRKGVR